MLSLSLCLSNCSTLCFRTCLHWTPQNIGQQSVCAGHGIVRPENMCGRILLLRVRRMPLDDVVLPAAAEHSHQLDFFRLSG